MACAPPLLIVAATNIAASGIARIQPSNPRPPEVRISVSSTRRRWPSSSLRSVVAAETADRNLPLCLHSNLDVAPLAIALAVRRGVTDDVAAAQVLDHPLKFLAERGDVLRHECAAARKIG